MTAEDVALGFFFAGLVAVIMGILFSFTSDNRGAPTNV